MRSLMLKNGGIRPIAVGNTFIRFATKDGMRPFSKDLGHHLRLIQLGFGTPGGREAVVHTCLSNINSSLTERTCCILWREAAKGPRRSSPFSLGADGASKLPTIDFNIWDLIDATWVAL